MYDLFKDAKITDESFLVVIEISKGSKNKYEYDRSTGLLHLDRILYTSTHYPQNYGFIPLTWADDGDPLDVLVLCSEQILPLSTIQCRPIGIIKMIDGGKKDYKVIAVPENDPFYNDFTDVSQIPMHMIEEIKHFFKVYKSLEGKETTIKDLYGKEEAKEVIRSCIACFNKD
ncbi:MAG: inorganic diphosphatase [Erysipelotrichaceae bacterium]|nr:inorganic diphosphatase [Erysipelotrichaceae bacterium]